MAKRRVKTLRKPPEAMYKVNTTIKVVSRRMNEADAKRLRTQIKRKNSKAIVAISKA
ncbi:MAG: hypothetical protein KAQ85_00165 [Thermodesulfovibrionia bacterium]|nr:hypothetical protein [Thermodesulfovibrionia bacterium]